MYRKSYAWNVLKLGINIWTITFGEKDYSHDSKSTRLWIVIVMLECLIVKNFDEFSTIATKCANSKRKTLLFSGLYTDGTDLPIWETNMVLVLQTSIVHFSAGNE